MNPIALALARRYGNTPAWRVARRIVERAQLQLTDLSLFLYGHDAQRIAREAVRERNKDEDAKQALSDLDALLARLAADGRTEAAPAPAPVAPSPEDAERFREAGRVLGRKVIDDMLLRASTGKIGRN